MSTTRYDSPFSAILEPYADVLPPAFREQYLLPANAPYHIELGGQMRRVWHRPRWLWPVFWLLAQGNTFFPETGHNIPAQLIVRAGRGANGEPWQTWERIFYFPGRQRRYASQMTYDSRRALVAEWQGPNQMLQEMAEVRFTPPNTLEFLTVESWAHFGRNRVGLPRGGWVTAHVVETAHTEQTALSDVRLTITHPWFGPIFGYEGTFRARRRYHSEKAHNG
jgi:hypothetical protein